MKSETVIIHVQRFTDDNGNPSCEECLKFQFSCRGLRVSRVGDFDLMQPTDTCPIWHNAVKPKFSTFGEWKEFMGNNVGNNGYSAEDIWEASRQ